VVGSGLETDEAREGGEEGRGEDLAVVFAATFLPKLQGCVVTPPVDLSGLGMSTFCGVLCAVLLPFPSWLSRLYPMVYTDPSSVRTAEKCAPQWTRAGNFPSGKIGLVLVSPHPLHDPSQVDRFHSAPHKNS
jgi:hypothetical protein